QSACSIGRGPPPHPALAPARGARSARPRSPQAAPAPERSIAKLSHQALRLAPSPTLSSFDERPGRRPGESPVVYHLPGPAARRPANVCLTLHPAQLPPSGAGGTLTQLTATPRPGGSMLAPSTRALIAFFDALAPRWNAMQSADRYERLARQLAPHAALFRDARLGLDIGTGTGAFLPHLARLAPHAQVIALDLSPVMLRMARASNGRDIVRAWLQGDVHRLPLPGAC